MNKYLAFLALLFLAISVNAAYITPTASTTPYCGDGICTNAGGYVSMSYYDESTPNSAYYCPRDCPTSTYSPTPYPYSSPSPSVCPRPNCRIVCDADVNGATNTGGSSGGGFSSGGGSTNVLTDGGNWLYLLAALILGALVGYYYKKSKKR